MTVCIEHNNFKSTQNHFSQNLSADKKAIQFSFVDASKWNVLRYIRACNARIRQRKDLAKLDERMLADIGYTSAQTREEFSKPFWK